MTRTLGAPPLRMTDEQRDELEKMARSFSSPYRSVVQARALLIAADGAANHEIARRLGVASNSVRTWQRRFEETRTSGVGAMAPGRGRRSSLPEGTVARVTREELPRNGATHWSTRALADRFGMGKDTLARIRWDSTNTPGTS
jgi:transposase